MAATTPRYVRCNFIRMGRPFKPSSKRHYIREWRVHRGYSQEQVAEELSVSKATISRLETGDQPYGQRMLEALAKLFGTEPANLLMPPLSDTEALWELWKQAQPLEKRQITDMARIILKTGTDA
ncbi:helix-turn-helix domain-containing protein [Enterovirga rhinocerotis]|uniref:helix-turn-helix domain-containing protein n=1 Tax=Enterovirga rhinocerotis TaxID=1339210 RepID=UPI00105D3BA1|nr:helix-turn-helix transcriptional regulator [Enterovirga rhinocerotis]